jgi:hypothetical protein
MVNFWLPIPTGAAAYISLKVPRGADWRAMRRALSDLVPKGARQTPENSGETGDTEKISEARMAAEAKRGEEEEKAASDETSAPRRFR